MGDIVRLKETTVAVCVGFRCDRCQAIHEDALEVDERKTIFVHGGFGSVFGDGVELQCTLCQNCVKECLGKYLSEPVPL